MYIGCVTHALPSCKSRNLVYESNLISVNMLTYLDLEWKKSQGAMRKITRWSYESVSMKLNGGMEGRSGTAEGWSGTAACSAGVCDDLTSGALLCHYRLSRQSCYMFLLLAFLPHCCRLYMKCIHKE